VAKDDAPLDLFIGTYPDAPAAEEAWRGLKQLADDEVVFVEGLALVNRDENGKIHVKDTKHEGGVGATIGAVGGAVLGLIFPPSLLASAVVGTAVGAGAGTTVDRLSKRRIKSDVEWAVPPGSSGVVVIFHEEWAAEVERALAGATRIERHHVHEDDEVADQGEDPRLA
jgi:uncharacterized membrane protein